MANHHRHRFFNPPWHPLTYAGSAHSIRKNRSWMYRPELLAQVPPVIIDRAGFTCWTTGEGWQEKKNPHLGIEYVVSGDARFTQNGTEYTVKPDSAYVIQRGQSSAFGPGPSGYLHKRFVFLSGSMLDVLLQSFGLNNCDRVTFSDTRWFARYFKRVSAAMGMPGQSGEKTKVLTILAFELLTELADNVLTAALPVQVRKAMEFMSVNINRNLTLPEIAAQSGVGLFHLLRLFRTTAGSSPMEFHARRRMAYAQSLLEQTTHSIKEIATILGFADPFYFTRQFKKHAGVSPREFRKKQHD